MMQPRRLVRWAAAALVLPSTASQAAPRPPLNAETRAQAVADASLRFGVPVSWIDAVIQAESGGNPHAVSSKGALGLMQVMPSTYADLSAPLRLGPDPLDVHDNVMAGAAYLRLMFGRYGVVGMVGAYNAGPARWEAYLQASQPLPSETVAELARLGPVLGFEGHEAVSRVSTAPPRSPLEAPIFVGLASRTPAGDEHERDRRIVEAVAANPSLVVAPNGLFAAVAGPAIETSSPPSPASPPPTSVLPKTRDGCPNAVSWSSSRQGVQP